MGKATIYRRWANKDALLVDAVAALKGPLPEIGGVSVRDDLSRCCGRSADSAMIRASSRAAMPDPRAQPQPALCTRCYQRVIEPRRELMRSVLRRGIAVRRAARRPRRRGRDGDAGGPDAGAGSRATGTPPWTGRPCPSAWSTPSGPRSPPALTPCGVSKCPRSVPAACGLERPIRRWVLLGRADVRVLGVDPG